MVNGQGPADLQQKSSGMAAASLALGTIGVLMAGCAYPAILFGSLAIILALLSRGGKWKVEGYAVPGLILGIISVAFGILVLVYYVVTVVTTFGGIDGYFDYLENLMEQMG
ncbi:hypothetical protein AALC25_12300 [Lachnospiraceae bacterium 29-84]